MISKEKGNQDIRDRDSKIKKLPKSIKAKIKGIHGFQMHTFPIIAHDNFRSFCFVQFGSFQFQYRNKQLLKCRNQEQYEDVEYLNKNYYIYNRCDGIYLAGRVPKKIMDLLGSECYAKTLRANHFQNHLLASSDKKGIFVLEMNRNGEIEKKLYLDLDDWDIKIVDFSCMGKNRIIVLDDDTKVFLFEYDINEGKFDKIGELDLHCEIDPNQEPKGISVCPKFENFVILYSQIPSFGFCTFHSSVLVCSVNHESGEITLKGRTDTERGTSEIFIFGYRGDYLIFICYYCSASDKKGLIKTYSYNVKEEVLEEIILKNNDNFRVVNIVKFVKFCNKILGIGKCGNLLSLEFFY